MQTRIHQQQPTHSIPTLMEMESHDGIEDANQDGNVDWTETDPNNPDTDNDGLTDGQEDANQDGVVDSTETNPILPDTDGDGIDDGTETGVNNDTDSSTTTDPLNTDSDGDGLIDGDETKTALLMQAKPIPKSDGCRYRIGCRPRYPNNPDPLMDSDGDGLLDGKKTRTEMVLLIMVKPILYFQIRMVMD